MDATNRRKAMVAIDRGLASAAGLTPAKKTMYRTAAEGVIDAMGPTALKRWIENVESITFYPDTESIERFLNRKRPDLANVSGTRGLCVRDRSHPHLCRLHLNGGDDTGDESPWRTDDTYAHEFGHTIDWGRGEMGPLSMSKAWREVSAEEKKEIRERLGVPDRGSTDDFANAAVMVWNHPEDARRHYPECWAFWSERGLVAASPADRARSAL